MEKNRSWPILRHYPRSLGNENTDQNLSHTDAPVGGFSDPGPPKCEGGLRHSVR
jgi:hypothetical protein